MATKFSPCKGSYVLNQFPSNVMFGMNGFHVSASGAIQGHHGPLVYKSKTIIFSIQREIIITSLLRKLTKVSKNNFKININRICDPLEMCKNITSA